MYGMNTEIKQVCKKVFHTAWIFITYLHPLINFSKTDFSCSVGQNEKSLIIAWCYEFELPSIPASFTRISDQINVHALFVHMSFCSRPILLLFMSFWFYSINCVILLNSKFRNSLSLFHFSRSGVKMKTSGDGRINQFTDVS